MKAVLQWFALGTVLAVAYVAGAGAQLQQGGTHTTNADLRQGIRLERQHEQAKRAVKCLRARVYRYTYVHWIPAPILHPVLNLQQRRVRAVVLANNRCEQIPAWPWMALASCESGRNWSYNGPSGFDGGFQFLPSTWNMAKAAVPRARGYAFAYQAPAYVQYLVARSWLARTSWDQWPTCSRAIGVR